MMRDGEGEEKGEVVVGAYGENSTDVFDKLSNKAAGAHDSKIVDMSGEGAYQMSVVESEEERGVVQGLREA